MESGTLFEQLFLTETPTLQQSSTVLVLTLAIVLNVILRAITNKLPLNIPDTAYMMGLGFIIGLLCMPFPFLYESTQTVEANPYKMVGLILPILIFNTLYSVDAHIFFRSISQILLIVSLGLVIHLAIITSVVIIVQYFKQTKTQFAEAALLATLCIPTYPLPTVQLLNNLGHDTKHLVTLLKGESVISLAISLTVFNVFNNIQLRVSHTYLDVFIGVIWSLGVGTIVGLVCSRVTILILRNRYNNPLNLIIWMLSLLYLFYFMASDYILCSGTLVIICVSISICFERPGFSKELDDFMMMFCNLCSELTMSLVSLIIGIYFTRNLIMYATARDYVLIFLIYFIVVLSRVVSFVVIFPCLSRMSYGFTYAKMVIMIWGGYKTPLCSAVACLGMYNVYGEFGITLLSCVSGVMFLHWVVNAGTMPLIMRILNLAELSNVRKANMNNCFRQVLVKRESCLSLLKMDRFLSDANWPLILKATMIKHPYSMKYDTDYHDDDYAHIDSLVCPDCHKDVPIESSPRELRQMRKEAKIKILKSKKISYTRQFEKGMLTEEAHRVLISAADVSKDYENRLVDLESLLKLFNKQALLHYTGRLILKIIFKKENLIPPPRKRFRRRCYYVVMHQAFDISIFSIIVLNVAPIFIETLNNPLSGSRLSNILVVVNSVFFLIYLTEFILKIMAYSWIYVWNHGVKTYFRSGWNVLDFVILILAALDLIFDYVDRFVESFIKSQLSITYLVKYLRLLRLIRLLRLLRLFTAWYPRIVKYFDYKVDIRLAFAYEIGKGFVTGDEEVISTLPQIVEQFEIMEEFKTIMEEEKLAVMRELGLVQKNTPWIAITVKTKQAMRSTLNSMLEKIKDLKTSGWIDDFEYMVLIKSLNERLKFTKRIYTVIPSEPKVIFSEVPWMAGDAALTDFLYEHIYTKLYDVGDSICSVGVVSEGIIIIVSGLFKLSYTPNVDSLDMQAENGCLPVVDYLSFAKIEDNVEDYIVSGNTVGELSVLTQRPYDCNIVAETQSQVYILTKEVVDEATRLCPDPIKGLEARLWRNVAIRVALSILLEVPAYQSLTQEEIKMILERGFVPDLTEFKIFTVNENIEDIILIEGITIDYGSKECFFGPCYIPRTIQRIILPRSSEMTILSRTEVKLFIIPARNVNEYDLMIRAEQISVLVPEAEYKCTEYVRKIRSKMKGSNKKRRKKDKEETYNEYIEVSTQKQEDSQDSTDSDSEKSHKEEVSSSFIKRKTVALITIDKFENTAKKSEESQSLVSSI